MQIVHINLKLAIRNAYATPSCIGVRRIADDEVLAVQGYRCHADMLMIISEVLAQDCPTSDQVSRRPAFIASLTGHVLGRQCFVIL